MKCSHSTEIKTEKLSVNYLKEKIKKKSTHLIANSRQK